MGFADFGPVDHQLETVVTRLYLPRRHNNYVTSFQAFGYSSTRRAHLWAESDEWEQTEQVHGLQVVDSVSHLLLVALQDRPTSQQFLEAGLVGEGWQQEELF